MSGGDLDGDEFSIYWDPRMEILPFDPMDFKSVSKKGSEPVTDRDLHNWFITFMQNTNLGKICHFHLAQADQQQHSALSDVCLELAFAASKAVDLPKNGETCEIQDEWMVKSYPDFMEKSFKPMYESKRALGFLYREVNRVLRLTNRQKQKLREIGANELLVMEGHELYLPAAIGLRQHYNIELQELMLQYSVRSEAELFCGAVFNYDKAGETSFRDVIDKAVLALRAIKHRYRQAFFAEFNPDLYIDPDFAKVSSDWTPVSRNVDHSDVNRERILTEAHWEQHYRMLQKAGAWYMAVYGSEQKQLGRGKLLSFAWLVPELSMDVFQYRSLIAQRRQAAEDAERKRLEAEALERERQKAAAREAHFERKRARWREGGEAVDSQDKEKQKDEKELEVLSESEESSSEEEVYVEKQVYDGWDYRTQTVKIRRKKNYGLTIVDFRKPFQELFKRETADEGMTSAEARGGSGLATLKEGRRLKLKKLKKVKEVERKPLEAFVGNQVAGVDQQSGIGRSDAFGPAQRELLQTQQRIKRELLDISTHSHRKQPPPEPVQHTNHHSAGSTPLRSVEVSHSEWWLGLEAGLRLRISKFVRELRQLYSPQEVFHKCLVDLPRSFNVPLSESQAAWLLKVCEVANVPERNSGEKYGDIKHVVAGASDENHRMPAPFPDSSAGISAPHASGASAHGGRVRPTASVLTAMGGEERLGGLSAEARELYKYLVRKQEDLTPSWTGSQTGDIKVDDGLTRAEMDAKIRESNENFDRVHSLLRVQRDSDDDSDSDSSIVSDDSIASLLGRARLQGQYVVHRNDGNLPDMDPSRLQLHDHAPGFFAELERREEAWSVANEKNNHDHFPGSSVSLQTARAGPDDQSISVDDNGEFQTFLEENKHWRVPGTEDFPALSRSAGSGKNQKRRMPMHVRPLGTTQTAAAAVRDAEAEAQFQLQKKMSDVRLPDDFASFPPLPAPSLPTTNSGSERVAGDFVDAEDGWQESGVVENPNSPDNGARRAARERVQLEEGGELVSYVQHGVTRYVRRNPTRLIKVSGPAGLAAGGLNNHVPVRGSSERYQHRQFSTPREEELVSNEDSDPGSDVSLTSGSSQPGAIRQRRRPLDANDRGGGEHQPQARALLASSQSLSSQRVTSEGAESAVRSAGVVDELSSQAPSDASSVVSVLDDSWSNELDGELSDLSDSTQPGMYNKQMRMPPRSDDGALSLSSGVVSKAANHKSKWWQADSGDIAKAKAEEAANAQPARATEVHADSKKTSRKDDNNAAATDDDDNEPLLFSLPEKQSLVQGEIFHNYLDRVEARARGSAVDGEFAFLEEVGFGEGYNQTNEDGGGWTCERCTLRNAMSAVRCVACGEAFRVPVITSEGLALNDAEFGVGPADESALYSNLDPEPDRFDSFGPLNPSFADPSGHITFERIEPAPTNRARDANKGTEDSQSFSGSHNLSAQNLPALANRALSHSGFSDDNFETDDLIEPSFFEFEQNHDAVGSAVGGSSNATPLFAPFPGSSYSDSSAVFAPAGGEQLGWEEQLDNMEDDLGSAELKSVGDSLLPSAPEAVRTFSADSPLLPSAPLADSAGSGSAAASEIKSDLGSDAQPAKGSSFEKLTQEEWIRLKGWADVSDDDSDDEDLPELPAFLQATAHLGRLYDPTLRDSKDGDVSVSALRARAGAELAEALRKEFETAKREREKEREVNRERDALFRVRRICICPRRQCPVHDPHALRTGPAEPMTRSHVRGAKESFDSRAAERERKRRVRKLIGKVEGLSFKDLPLQPAWKQLIFSTIATGAEDVGAHADPLLLDDHLDPEPFTASSHSQASNSASLSSKSTHGDARTAANTALSQAGGGSGLARAGGRRGGIFDEDGPLAGVFRAWEEENSPGKFPSPSSSLTERDVAPSRRKATSYATQGENAPPPRNERVAKPASKTHDEYIASDVMLGLFGKHTTLPDEKKMHKTMVIVTELNARNTELEQRRKRFAERRLAHEQERQAALHAAELSDSTDTFGIANPTPNPRPGLRTVARPLARTGPLDEDTASDASDVQTVSDADARSQSSQSSQLGNPSSLRPPSLRFKQITPPQAHEALNRAYNHPNLYPPAAAANPLRTPMLHSSQNPLSASHAQAAAASRPLATPNQLAANSSGHPAREGGGVDLAGSGSFAALTTLITPGASASGAGVGSVGSVAANASARFILLAMIVCVTDYIYIYIYIILRIISSSVMTVCTGPRRVAACVRALHAETSPIIILLLNPKKRPAWKRPLSRTRRPPAT
jgi:hypothetical protein